MPTASIRGPARLLVAAGLLGLALAGLTAAAPGGSRTACADSAHAALVVEHGGGAVIRDCVAFGGSSINGEQLLQMSGVEYRAVPYGGNGDAICQVDGEPPDPNPSAPNGGWTQNNCLSGGEYWAIYTATYGGSWQFADSGVSGITLHDGDAEGFHYSTYAGATPPPSPAGICPPPQPAPSTASPSGVSPGSGSGSGSGGGHPGSSPGGSGARPAASAPPPSPGSGLGDVASSASPSPSPAHQALANAGSGSGHSRAGAPPLPAPRDLIGLGVAGAAGAGLVGLLVLQLVRPRLRR